MKKVLEEFLIREWSTGLRVTTIPQVMGRLGMADDQRLRWSVAKRLEGFWRDALMSPEKREQIAVALGRPLDEVREEQWRQQVSTWHLASVLLSEDEKLVARHILMRQSRALPLPRQKDAVEALGLPVPAVHKALRVLARLGFLSLSDMRHPASYTLAEDHERFLEGLGFSFHTVTLDTVERFAVPWAVDFLLLVSSQYRDHHVTLDDACAHCVDRIHIEADHGQLVRVEPTETVVYRGGTWGKNNLFRSEEHLREWNGGTLPDRDRWKPVHQFMEAVSRLSSW